MTTSKAVQAARERGDFVLNPYDPRSRSGRPLLPLPKAKGERAYSLWLIEGARAEAAASGCAFHQTLVRAVRPGKKGDLPVADICALNDILFGTPDLVAIDWSAPKPPKRKK